MVCPDRFGAGRPAPAGELAAEAVSWDKGAAGLFMTVPLRLLLQSLARAAVAVFIIFAGHGGGEHWSTSSSPRGIPCINAVRVRATEL